MGTDKIFVASGNNARRLWLEVGKEYIVKPHNLRKLKNRDREVRILEFVHADRQDPESETVARVRFLDSNRIGQIPLGDLAELT